MEAIMFQCHGWGLVDFPNVYSLWKTHIKSLSRALKRQELGQINEGAAGSPVTRKKKKKGGTKKR